MSKPTIRIHDLSTNEVIDREMNDQEFAAYEADQAAQATKQAEATAKAAQRRAILDHLKITEEEARILLGGN
jgi:signal-transduction protein with cAMP-binding, CBS, and nucleotidyltransferase domain